MKKNKLFICGLAAALLALPCSGQVTWENGWTVLPDPNGLYYMGLDISSNGQYVCGTTGEGYMFITDLTTGTTSISEGEMVEARGVSDDGVAVGYNPNAVTLNIDGTLTELEPGAELGSLAEDITPDGSLIVGYSDFASSFPHACVYKDGVKTMLPEPTDKWLGFTDNGTQAKYVSDDGSVIVGWLYDDMATLPAIAWRENKDGSYSADPIMRGLFEPAYGDNPYWAFQPTGLSGNGRYVALILMESDSWEYTVGRYDLENNTLEVCEKSGEVTGDLSSTGIADDGTMIGYINSSTGGMYGRVGWIWKAGETAPQYISTVYSKAGFADFEGGDATANSPIKISADGRYIVGFGVSATGIQTYVLDTESYSDDYEPSSISNTVAGNEGGNEIKDVYSINGVKLHTPMTGVNIVRRGNGTTQKVIMK